MEELHSLYVYTHYVAPCMLRSADVIMVLADNAWALSHPANPAEMLIVHESYVKETLWVPLYQQI